MGGSTVFRVLLAILVIFVLVLAFRVLSPQNIRDEGVMERPEPAARDTGRAIPEDVLAVPEMSAYAGLMGPMDGAHWFMPYAIVNEAQGIAMVKALTALFLAGSPLPEKLEVPAGAGAAGGEYLYPIEPNVAAMFYGDGSDAPGEVVDDSDVPLIISQPKPGDTSADVLFMDGHIEPVPVGRFPLTPGLIEALSALDTPEHAEPGGTGH